MIFFYWLQRAQTEAVTFLGNQDSSRSLYAIPGLDYVAHEDILPYTTTEKQPLQHELFDKFLMYYPDKGNFKFIDIIHHERRGQVNTIMMEHFNCILFHKFGPTNK